MSKIIVCFVVLLGLSACEYSSQTRVATAPVAQSDIANVKDSLTGVQR